LGEVLLHHSYLHHRSSVGIEPGTPGIRTCIPNTTWNKLIQITSIRLCLFYNYPEYSGFIA
jgi:hypothetical protein